MKIKTMCQKIGFLICFVGLLCYTLAAGQRVSAKETETNTCGASAVWTFDQETKQLSITGTGKIECDDDWYELGITKISIGKGISEIGNNAFSNLEAVTEITLPSTLTKIDSYSFSNCKKLKKITLPKSLLEIQEQAFYNCGKLKTVKIPDSVTFVGYGVFEGCKSLTSVTLPKTMTMIPDMMFYRCKKLTSFLISENITSIGSSAFSRSGLKEVNMPKTVKEIGTYIYSSCASLDTVTWNAEMIPDGAFDGCESLEAITCGKAVKTMGNHAFSETGFKKYTIPESVTYIGEGIFSSCNNLTKLTITKNVETIPRYVVANSSNLEKVVVKDGVKKVDDYAFCNSYMKTVSLPSSIKSIGERAFRRSFCLTSIKIPDSVKRVEDYTFSYCEQLTDVKFGNNVKEIGECAFYKCPLLGAVTIPKSVKKIGYKAFKLSGITSLTIGDGLEEIDYWAFTKCQNLKEIKLGKSVRTVRFNAFIQCDNLSKITVDSNNKNYTAYNNVLYSKNMSKLIYCPTEKSGVFTIPAKVSKIYGSSFSNCTKITAFAVDPKNPYFSVEDGILYNKNKTVLVSCPSGKKGTIKVRSSVTEIQDYAFHYSQAKNIILPSGLKTIGYCAFEYCPKLEKIVIPGSVRTLESAAFWRCPSLKEVEIGNGLTKIPDDAFYECSSLKKISVPVSVTSISSTAFQNCSYEITFYTKKSSYAMKYATKNYYRYKII